MPDTHLLYTKLLAASPTVPTRLLEGATMAALNAPDSSNLAQLIAGRVDLTKEGATAILGVNDPKITDARKVAERALLIGATNRVPERRAAVLAKNLRNNYSPNGWLVQDAIDAFMAKPTKALYTELMGRPSTWYTPDEVLALFSYAGASEQAPPQNRYSRLVEYAKRLGRDRAAALLRTHPRKAILIALLYTPVDVDAVIEAVNHHARMHGNEDRFLDIVQAAVDTHRTAEEREQILTGLETGYARCLYGVAIQIKAYRQRTWEHWPATWDTSEPTRPRPASSLEDAGTDTLCAHAASTNPAALADVVAALRGRRQDAREYAKVTATLVTNPYVTQAVLDELTQFLRDQHDYVRTVIGYSDELEHIDPLDLFDWDTPLVQLWLEARPGQVLRRHGWTPFDATIPELWEKWRHDNGTCNQVVEALTSTSMTTAELLDTPMFAVHLLIGRHQGGETLAIQVGRLLADRLNTPEKFRMFNSLNEQFEGTLRELLNLCDEMAN